MRDRSARVAECLRDIGIGPGSTIGLSMENRIEFGYIMFGAFMAGATVTGLNPVYNEGNQINLNCFVISQLTFVSFI